MQDRMLEVFLAVAMSRTFGKAADMLNVTPSSVSRELKSLEDEVGMLLVDRQKGVKSIKLTPAGESLLPLVLKWQETRKEISDSYNSRSACYLSVAGNEVANNSLLPQLFLEMLEHDPPVHLKITTDPTDMLYERIESREIDVAFAVHQEPSRFVRIAPIYEDRLVVARLEKSRRRPRAKKTISPAELAPENELYIEWSREFRLWHDKTWDTDASRPIQLLSPYLLPHLMKQPGQWSVLPHCIRETFRNSAEMERNDTRIAWYRLASDEPTLTFFKLTHRHPKLSALKGLETMEGLLSKIRLGPKQE